MDIHLDERSKKPFLKWYIGAHMSVSLSFCLFDLFLNNYRTTLNIHRMCNDNGGMCKL